MKINTKKDGFYMNITPEEREVIDNLQRDYAINISAAFKLFLKQLLDKMRDKI